MARKILKGLDNFFYAKMVTSSDTATVAPSYEAPVAIEGAVSVSYNPNGAIETFYADNGPFEVEETIGDQDFEVSVADVSQEILADLLGQTITGGVVEEVTTDRSPYVAFGFRGERSGGGYSYIWLYKGKFMKTPMNIETRGAAIGFQPLTLTAKFVARTYDSKYKGHTRTDANDYTAATGTAWFTSVYGSSLDITNPTFSSSIPSANGTSATQTTNITLTFSEPIMTSSVTAANFVILQASSAATVSASLSVSSGIVTMTISAILTASTSYNVLMGTGIKDLAGNSLSAPQTFKFTTSA